MEYNEKEILEALRNEKTKYHAFSQLVEHYREPLYWRIRRIVIAHEDANDVLQNTFIKVWSNMDKFQMRAQFSTWINRIAINESLDFLRSKKDKISTDEYGGVAGLVTLEDLLEEDYWLITILMVMRHKHCCRRQSQHCLKYSEQSLICVTLTK